MRQTLQSRTAVATAPDLLWPRYDQPEDLATIERVPLETRPLPSSTYGALRTTATRQPDGAALVVLADGQRWDAPVQVSYGELFRAVTSYANALTSLGVTRCDTVGLLSPNVLAMIPALLAAEAASIAVPVNPGLSRENIVALLHRAGVKALIAAGPDVDAEIWQLALSIATELELPVLLALEPTAPDPRSEPDLEPLRGTYVAYLDAVARAVRHDRLLSPEPEPGDLASLFHTGGTTGTPKLAAHTHAMEVVDAWSIAAISTLTPATTIFAALPLFHVNALVVTTLAPILRGMRAVWAGPLGYRDPALIRSFWKIVERYQISSVSAVPSVYETLTRVPVDADISSLKLPVVGAAPLPQAVREAWLRQTGVDLCEGYGLTEATCATSRSFPDHPRPDSVGQRMPYQRVAAVEIDRQSGRWTFLPPGRVGSIAITGPTVFPGYVVGRSDDGPVLEPGDKLHDGWLDTGDLGAVSADGFVLITGRAKDIIIRGGHNIDPAAVEAVLRQHPSVIDAGVVGRPDQHAGEVPVAFVVVDDATVDADDIGDWAAAHVTERAAAPKSVTILPTLPHTAVGKPYKVGLRLLATREELTAKLTEVGYRTPADDTWCAERDGQVIIALPAPADTTQRAAVSAVLERYTLTWRFA